MSSKCSLFLLELLFIWLILKLYWLNTTDEIELKPLTPGAEIFLYKAHPVVPQHVFVYAYTLGPKDVPPTVYNYSICSQRLASFRRWSETHPVSAARLAENGFFYIDNDFPYVDDSVMCSACEVTIAGWQSNDDIAEVHRRSSPNCIFVTSQTGITSSGLQANQQPPVSYLDSFLSRFYSTRQENTPINNVLPQGNIEIRNVVSGINQQPVNTDQDISLTSGNIPLPVNNNIPISLTACNIPHPVNSNRHFLLTGCNISHTVNKNRHISLTSGNIQHPVNTDHDIPLLIGNIPRPVITDHDIPLPIGNIPHPVNTDHDIPLPIGNIPHAVNTDHEIRLPTDNNQHLINTDNDIPLTNGNIPDSRNAEQDNLLPTNNVPD